MFMLMGLNQIFHVLFRKKKKVKPSLNIKITLFPMKALFSPFFLSLPFFILFFFFHLFFHFKSQERNERKCNIQRKNTKQKAFYVKESTLIICNHHSGYFNFLSFLRLTLFLLLSIYLSIFCLFFFIIIFFSLLSIYYIKRKNE